MTASAAALGVARFKALAEPLPLSEECDNLKRMLMRFPTEWAQVS